MAFDELVGQSYVLQETRRATCMLLQSFHDSVPKVEEVTTPAMSVNHGLIEPAPELFNGVEPRRVGGEKQDFNLRESVQSFEHGGETVVWPVVPNKVDAFGIGIPVWNLPQALDESFRGH